MEKVKQNTRNLLNEYRRRVSIWEDSGKFVKLLIDNGGREEYRARVNHRDCSHYTYNGIRNEYSLY